MNIPQTCFPRVVIIGGGFAGLAAARGLEEQELQVVLIDKHNYHTFQPLLYQVATGGLEPDSIAFPLRKRFNDVENFYFRLAEVTNIDADQKEVQTTIGNLAYDYLIIATGSKPNKFGWPGQDLKGVQGLYSKQDLDNLEKYAPNKDVCKRAVIVGGGLIGIELAEMLRSRDIPVTFLVRESSFWNGVLPDGESAMINEHILEHHIDLRLSTACANSFTQLISTSN